MAEINLGKVKGDEVTEQSIASALGFPVKDIVIISQSEYDALLPHEQEGERLFFIKDELGKIFYKNQLVWDLPGDGYWVHKDTSVKTYFGLDDPSIANGIMSSPSWKNDCSEVKIPLGVTGLGDNCFAFCLSLTSITIPVGVTSLGIGCFEGCYALPSITIPVGVTSIGDNCFTMCQSFTSITLPVGVNSLGNNCFSNTSLTSINIPAGVNSLGNNCFSDTSLTSINIPESVTILEGGCFKNCSSLASITLPKSVNSLGAECFKNCSSLASITLPESVNSLGAECFSGTSLTSITLPESVTIIGSMCFSGTSLTLATVLPATPPSLEWGAFNFVHESFNIKVRSPYVDAYKIATNWTEYAGKISAI